MKLRWKHQVCVVFTLAGCTTTIGDIGGNTGGGTTEGDDDGATGPSVPADTGYDTGGVPADTGYDTGGVPADTGWDTGFTSTADTGGDWSSGISPDTDGESSSSGISPDTDSESSSSGVSPDTGGRSPCGCEPGFGCVEYVGFSVETACVPIPPECAGAIDCACGSSVCVEPYTACIDNVDDPDEHAITCECPTC